MREIWLLTCGTGDDGDEWYVLGAYTTQELAKKAKQRYERPRPRPDGSTYCFSAYIEEWELNVDQFSETEF